MSWKSQWIPARLLYSLDSFISNCCRVSAKLKNSSTQIQQGSVNKQWLTKDYVHISLYNSDPSKIFLLIILSLIEDQFIFLILVNPINSTISFINPTPLPPKPWEHRARKAQSTAEDGDNKYTLDKETRGNRWETWEHEMDKCRRDWDTDGNKSLTKWGK